MLLVHHTVSEVGIRSAIESGTVKSVVVLDADDEANFEDVVSSAPAQEVGFEQGGRG